MTTSVFDYFEEVAATSPVPLGSHQRDLLKGFYAAGAIAVIQAIARSTTDDETLETCRELLTQARFAPQFKTGE